MNIPRTKVSFRGRRAAVPPSHFVDAIAPLMEQKHAEPTWLSKRVHGLGAVLKTHHRPELQRRYCNCRRLELRSCLITISSVLGAFFDSIGATKGVPALRYVLKTEITIYVGGAWALLGARCWPLEAWLYRWWQKWILVNSLLLEGRMGSGATKHETAHLSSRWHQSRGDRSGHCIWWLQNPSS